MVNVKQKLGKMVDIEQYTEMIAEQNDKLTEIDEKIELLFKQKMQIC